METHPKGTATLVEFLLARVADDEAEAREAIAERTRAVPDYKGRDMLLVSWPDVGLPAVLVGAERVLAECEAKRRILEHCERDLLTGHPGDEHVLRLLALPYAGHPDYREEWKP